MAFSNPVVAGEELIVPALRSENYVESVTGWRLGRDGTAQLENVNVLNTLGADDGSFATLSLAGDDVGTALAGITGGLIVYGYISGTHTGDIAAVRTKLLRMDVGPVVAGRCYKIECHGHFEPTVQTDNFDFDMTFSTDGTIPGVGNTILPGSLTRAQGSASFTCRAIYIPTVDVDNLRLSLNLARVAGTGTAKVYLTDANRRTEWYVEDLGLQLNVTQASIAQISKAVGGGSSDPEPTANYTRTYPATWSRTYDGDNSTTWDDSAYCYQGFYDSNRGSTRSLVGFNYSQIMADLAGATNIVAKVSYRVVHTYYNAGSTILIGGHSYTTKPSTWNSVNVSERLVTKLGVAGGSYTVTLTAAMATGLQNGGYKGIAFGPSVDNNRSYYAYLNGASQSGYPRLIISYRK